MSKVAQGLFQANFLTPNGREGENVTEHLYIVIDYVFRWIDPSLSLKDPCLVHPDPIGMNQQQVFVVPHPSVVNCKPILCLLLYLGRTWSKHGQRLTFTSVQEYHKFLSFFLSFFMVCPTYYYYREDCFRTYCSTSLCLSPCIPFHWQSSTHQRVSYFMFPMQNTWWLPISSPP